MHRLLRFGFVVALLVSVVAWAGSTHGVAAQGTVYTDTMDASSTHLLSTESPDVSKYLYSYQNNQFIIQTLQTGLSGDLIALTAVPDLADASVAVDFAIAGGLTGKYAFVGCRAADSNSGYELEVHPDSGVVNIWRIEPQTSTNLATLTDTAAVKIGNGNNRIEIRCVGNTISGLVNGQQIVTAQDTMYTSGSTYIGAGKSSETTDQLLVGFDNLTITDLTGGAVAQPTQAPVQSTQAAGFPTAIPAQPTQAPLQPTTSAGAATGATSPITDPRVDPDGTLGDAFIISLTDAPVAGPLDANDNLANNDFKYLSTGVQVRDFYAELYYITPPATPAGSWAIGFSFWDDGQGNSYDLFLQAKNGVAKWGFGQTVSGTYTLLQSGDLVAGAVDFAPGAENFLSIAVYQGVAILSGNEFEVDATVDLGAATGSGDVSAEVGFLADDTTTTQTLPVSFSEFAVWDISAGVVSNLSTEETTTPVTEPTQAAGLPTAIPAQPTQGAIPTVAPPPLVPTATTAGATTSNTANALLTQIFSNEKNAAMAGAPVFTSASGTLTQTLDSFNIVSAGLSLTDVYVTATFVNPTDMSTISDCGIGIRDLNDNTEFRFVVGSDGLWTLSLGSTAPFAQGTVTNFNPAPGASNTLELIAKGATGILVLNGQAIQQVDLSANLNAGNVYIGSGMVPSATVDQRQVPYSNFAVYQLTA